MCVCILFSKVFSFCVFESLLLVHISLRSLVCMYFQLLACSVLMCSCVLTPTLCPVLILSVSCQMEMVICVFHVAVFFFFPSSALIPFKHADKFNPFFGAVCWLVWCRQKLLSYSVAQKGSVVTNLTAWLNSWGVCWLFACHLTGWLTDLWMTEWLASFQTWWHADKVTDWLQICLVGHVIGYVAVSE